MLSAFLAIIDSEADQTKFRQIYERYKNLVYNIVYRNLKDYHLAQDATQVTFMRVAKCIKRFDEIDSQDTINIVSTIARFAAIDTHNTMQPDIITSNEWSKLIDTKDFDYDFSADYILEKMYKLDKKYSSVLLLKCQYDFTAQEIADALDLPLTTVKGRLQRGRLILAEKLKNDS